MNPAEIIGVLRNSLDYDRYVCDEDIPSPDDVKILNLNQLQLSAARYPDIQSFLNYTDTFQDEMVNDMEGVSLYDHSQGKKGWSFLWSSLSVWLRESLRRKKGISRRKGESYSWAYPGQ